MIGKRKAENGATGDAPQKKTRTEPEEHLGRPSDDSDDNPDYKVHYTENGNRRAQSEARRQWKYVCTFEGCDQRFNRPCRLESHLRTHSKERPFACSDCDKTFPRKDHLQRHIKNAHSDFPDERIFHCDWQGCGKSFTTNARLQRHKDVHESKFYCTEYPPCTEIFRKEKTLEAHIKEKHLEVKPYPCTFVDETTGEECPCAYLTEHSLQRHVNTAHAPGNKSELYCMICAMPGEDTAMVDTETGGLVEMPKEPLVFASHEELKAHIHVCHPPECTECGQKFKTDSNLKSHFTTVHGDPSQQRQYPCPKSDCGSVFNRKHNLTVHIQSVHDKHAKYVCTADAVASSKHEDLKSWNGENACGAAFKAKSSLDQHVRTHHLGLGTRKQARKAAKSKKKPEPSMLSMLTGIGYENTRNVACLVPTCEYRFYMDRDLRRHLHAEHNISDEDIEDMIRERDALSGGTFWIGGINDSMIDSVTQTPSMPETPLAPYFADGPVMAHDGSIKPMGAAVSYLGEQFADDIMDEDAKMDAEMGLGDLAPATNVAEGLQWDMLVPVEHNLTE